MIDAPRPMSLGEILDRTINFYRSRFLLFFGIAVLPTGLIIALVAGGFLLYLLAAAARPASIQANTFQGMMVLAIFPAVIVALPLILGAIALADAAITHAVNLAWYGEKTTIRAAYKAIWPRGWRYIGLYILKAIAVWGVPFVAYFVGAMAVFGFSMAATAAGGSSSGVGVIIILLVLIVIVALMGYVIWMLLLLCLSFPACVIEQQSAWQSLKRSIALTKGTRLRISLLYLLGTVLGWMLSGGTTVIVTLLATLIPGVSSPQHAQAFGMVIFATSYGSGFAVQALAKPVYSIALTLFYYDQRIRNEGFDIEWMMYRAGMVAAPEPVSVETVPALPSPEFQPDLAQLEPPSLQARPAPESPAAEEPPASNHAPIAEPQPAAPQPPDIPPGDNPPHLNPEPQHRGPGDRSPEPRSQEEAV